MVALSMIEALVEACLGGGDGINVLEIESFCGISECNSMSILTSIPPPRARGSEQEPPETTPITVSPVPLLVPLLGRKPSVSVVLGSTHKPELSRQRA